MENCMPVVAGGVGDLDALRQLRGAMNALPPAGGPKPSGVPAEGEAEQRREDEKREEGTQSGKGVKKKKEKNRRSVRPSKAVVKDADALQTSTSDSGSSMTSSSQRSRAGGLSFGEEDRIRQLSPKMALREVRNLLLVSAGEAEAPGATGPLFVRCWRQNLRHGMSPVLNRESLTVAYALDELLRGRVASAADVLCQRLKSLESLSGGSHWSTCQKLEVVPEEGASLVGREEAKIANRESRRSHGLGSYPPCPMGGNKIPGGWPGRGERKGEGEREERQSRHQREACGQGASAGLEVTVTGRGVADNVAACSSEPWLGRLLNPISVPFRGQVKFNAIP